MRKIAGILGVVGLLLCVAAIGVAADPPEKKDKKDEAKDNISKLAEDIFAKFDKHNHGYLNKYEFKKADADLLADITQLAKDGLIGKGKSSQNKSDAKSGTTPFVGGFADADTDKDKKVTLAEFTDYVGRAIQAADQELRAAAAAQRANGGSGNGRGAGGRR